MVLKDGWKSSQQKQLLRLEKKENMTQDKDRWPFILSPEEAVSCAA